jgi:outer membrane receptor for ferric coprogen and ferric-rhodotorulic acid
MTTFPSVRRRLVAAAALAAIAAPALAQSPRAAAPSSRHVIGRRALAMAPAATSALPEQPLARRCPLVVAADVQRVTITGSADEGYGGHASSSATGLDLSLRETPQSVTVISREQNGRLRAHDDQRRARADARRRRRIRRDRPHLLQLAWLRHHELPVRRHRSALLEREPVGRPRHLLLRSASTSCAARTACSRPTGNPSATVDIARKRPTREFQASAALTLGSWNDKAHRGRRRRRTGRERHGARPRHRLRRQKDSYLDRYGKDTRGVATLVDIDLAPRTTLTAGYQQQSSDADSPMWGALPLTTPTARPQHYDVSTSTATDWAW